MARKHWILAVAIGLAASGVSFAQDDDPFNKLPDIMPEREGGNPVLAVRDIMGDVVGDLGKMSTGKPTQAKQKDIVDKLDLLIKELEKQCNCNGGGSTSRPTSHLKDSQIVGGPGGIGDLRDAKKGEKKWAQLPPHERDRILQSMTEGFPAQYQEVLERYYRRLADEKTIADAQAKAPEGDKPATANPSTPKTDTKPEATPPKSTPTTPAKK